MSDFDAIMRQLKILRDSGQSDRPTYSRLCDAALRCAPDWLVTEIMDRAVKDGLLPPATGVDADGNRLWRLEDVARHLGLSESEIQESLEQFQELHGKVERINPETIQRLH